MRFLSPQVSFLLLSLCVSTLVSGCGNGPLAPAELNVPSEEINGYVIGGQNPINGATISVYSYGSSGYGSHGTLLASTTTNALGGFSFASGAYTCPTSTTPLYLLSVGGNTGGGINTNAVLGAALGTCTHAKSSSVNLNEITTVGLAYALSHYFTTTLGSTAPDNDAFGGPSGSLGLANANNNTSSLIVQLATGAPISSGGIVTTESPKVLSIANILAACVNSTGQTSTTETTTPCGKLFNDTTPPGATVRPSDTLQAAVNMALYPTQSVSPLFNIPSKTKPFIGDLTAAPADWSLAVKFTGSGLGLGVDTTTLTSLDIDSTGRVWFPSNLSGHVGVVYFDPASLTFNGPFNGTTMTHPEQVAIDNTGDVWLNDTQSAKVSRYSTTSTGTFAAFTLPNTNSYSLALGHDSRVNVGLFDSGQSKYMLANISADRSTYTETATALPVNFLPVSLVGDAAGNSFFALANTTTTNFQHFEKPAGSTTLTRTDTASDGTGTTAYNGADLLGTRSYSTAAGSASAVDGICFESSSACFSLKGSNKNGITGIAVDGAKTIWMASGLTATVNAAPMTAGGSGTGLAASYTVAVGSAQQIAVNTYTHNSTNGNTLVSPAGIAIDNSGNVWVSNVGCTTTNCAPEAFALTEIIGAAAPTITPISAQISGSNLAGTKP